MPHMCITFLKVSFQSQSEISTFLRTFYPFPHLSQQFQQFQQLTLHSQFLFLLVNCDLAQNK